MKMIAHYNVLHRLTQLGLLALGRTFGLGLVAILFVAWILTEPFFYLGDLLARRQMKPKDE